MTTTTADTKTRILDAAELLFADRGFAATSLRDITTEAGVNLAAVNYHFGSKEALLGAVFARRLGPTNRDRLDLLDRLEAEAGDGSPDVEAIVRAFLVPPFTRLQQWGEHGARFMQLVGRTHSESSELIQECFVRQFEEISRRFAGALARALPHLDRQEVKWRLHFVIGAMAHTLAWGDKLASHVGGPLEPDAVLERLVGFSVAGLRSSVRPPGGAGGRT